MTREEFIVGYVGRSGISRESFDIHLIALPCECGDDSCDGWAAVRKSESSVLDHLRSYTWPALGGGDETP